MSDDHEHGPTCSCGLQYTQKDKCINCGGVVWLPPFAAPGTGICKACCDKGVTHATLEAKANDRAPSVDT